jgi:hypothetical protein
VFTQRSGRAASIFSTLHLNLPDAPGVLIGELSNQQQPFHLYHSGIGLRERVEVFKSVIGQDGELIKIGDYIKLSVEDHEVSLGSTLPN